MQNNQRALFRTLSNSTSCTTLREIKIIEEYGSKRFILRVSNYQVQSSKFTQKQLSLETMLNIYDAEHESVWNAARNTITVSIVIIYSFINLLSIYLLIFNVTSVNKKEQWKITLPFFVHVFSQ